MENIHIARKKTYFIFVNIMEHIFYRIIVLEPLQLCHIFCYIPLFSQV